MSGFSQLKTYQGESRYMFPPRWFHIGLLLAVIVHPIFLDSLPARTNAALIPGASCELRVAPDGVPMRRLEVPPGTNRLEIPARALRPDLPRLVLPATTWKPTFPDGTRLADRTWSSLLTPAFEFKASPDAEKQPVVVTIPMTGEDHHPPYIVNYLPPRYATTVPVTQKIVISLRDDISGVDTNSVQLQLNSRRVSPRFSGSLQLLEVVWDTVWNYNDSIQVSIAARDCAEPPNRMSPEVYYFKTKTDRKPPFIYNRLPVADAQNVTRNTAIRFTLMDEPAGIAVNTIRLFVNQQEVTGWQVQGDSTQLEIRYQPPTSFDFAQSVQIGVMASDQVRPANVMSRVDWEFTTEIETDTLPPYTLNHQPGRFATNVPLDAAIQIQIQDDAHGVDLQHLNMWVNAQVVRPEVVGNSQRYTLFYRPPAPFNYNDTVWVRIQATDLAVIPNSMPDDVYYFTTVVDREPPFLTDLFPPAGASGVSPLTQVHFHLRDVVAGVDQKSIQLWLNDQLVAPGITGQTTDYTVNYQPSTPFSNGQRVFGKVLAQDLSQPPNAMAPLELAFQVAENLPDLVLKEMRTTPANGIKKNQLVTIEAIIENQAASITHPFQVSFWDNRGVIAPGDTVIPAMLAGTQISVKRTTRLQPGAHYLTVMADSREDVPELNEVNNSQDLYLDVTEGRFLVRPNPFTPNGDGYNDEVQFSFSELNLNQPRLQLFNFENRRLLTWENPANSQFYWNGTDAAGNALPPGIYLYVLEDGARFVASGCVILAR